ncbi:MAG: UvrD-helicase domain-containing protein, partial [Gemmatimonadetes bacterium]|nr:UvrD-helicase domain-containing protein [Gemmatimonadota bacterium]
MTGPVDRPLADRSERDAIRADLDDTLFVEAAAGTGKTTALVGRIVEILRRGRAELDRIVAVTFTEKAAGEMKLRLRAEIETARGRPDVGREEAAHLERALEQLELAHIGTIHGFCADLLKERPIEAGVDPAFQVAAEEEAGRHFDLAFDRWFETAVADPGPGVRRALRRNYGRSSGGPRAKLRDAAFLLSEQRDFDAAWSRPDFDRAEALDRAVDRVRELGELGRRAAREDDYFTRNLLHLDAWTRELDLREAIHGRDHDYLEAQLRTLLRSRRAGWHWTGFKTHEFAEGLLKSDVVDRRDAIKSELDDIVSLADAELAADLREELRPVIERYEAIKRREGRLDFVDLLIRTRDLLVGSAEIRAYYRRRFTHFFVDEFQDTDPLQVEILLLLSAELDGEPKDDALRPAPGKLFLVGDPKQSIYRFRRADVMLYERTKRRLEDAGARVLQLTTSFRSQPRIQAAVNGAFARCMTGRADGSQADYVPLTPFREDIERQPGVVALPVPRPYGRYGSIWKNAIERSLPDAVGAWIDWLIHESGWTVTEREDPTTPVPVRARHVCLLFRRLQSWGEDVTRPYVRALETREIPHVLVGGRSYFDREEVLAVYNALTAIEWPDDRLSVYAALRGPLFSLGDGSLLHFTSEIGPLHPLAGHAAPGNAERLDAMPSELRAVAVALEILGDLHRERNRRPIPETILRLLGSVRAHAGIAIWPTGEQALANVLRVVDRARSFERTGAPSFRAFLDRLEQEAERGQAEEAPIVEEGTDGVRIMTVHKAKGLEFPVVVLADMTCNATFETPSRTVDADRRLWAQPLCGAAPLDLLRNADVERERERAESHRLAYVAATRARDILVVPALGDGRDGEGGNRDAEREWWLDALWPSLAPPRGARREPGSAEALGAPPFGSESVLERLDRDGVPKPTPIESVAPGLHTAESGSEVVWWDPATLALDVDAPTGQRQRRLLEAEDEDQPSLEIEGGIAAHDEWQAGRARALESGARPRVRLQTVKARADAAAEEAAAAPAEAARVAWIEVDRPPDEERPRGSRFGELVHDALASIALDAERAVIERTVGARARRLGSPEGEVEAAVRLVGRALSHPVLRQAAAASPNDRRREV